MARITIHRGTHQIGGCVTEIATEKSRIFIDIGENLPGIESELPDIDSLTAQDGSNSAMFLTHYHSDHMGRVSYILPDIPVHMGKTAKAIQLNFAERIDKKHLPVYERIKTFLPLDRISVGDITVTAFMIDHSAFDAYMFLIEADGIRVLHTGDFRLHGFRGNKTLKMLKCYAKNIDYIICEGTMLSRKGENPLSERDIQKKAAEIMKTSPYVFVLCSSTNIDRIGLFYHANPKGRLFVCDNYQKKQLETVQAGHSDKSDFYNFKYVYDYAPNLDGYMEKKGFCMLVRQGEFFKRIMEKYEGNSIIIYSMWTGYLDERAKNQGLCDFLAPYQYHVLHTSGHASQSDLKKLYETVNPKCGLIPIHSSEPESFCDLIPNGNIIQLCDGEVFCI